MLRELQSVTFGVLTICKSCGGEIVGDETTAATACPSCGNPVVMTGQFSGALRPDYVIPFKLDKKAAKAALMKHYGGKKLLPKVFQDQNHIDEVKGVYVPFWLFDADVDAHVRYKATRIRTWSDSEYDYTETGYFSVVRGGSIGFERVPVDGSSKMADDLMESIEPFDFSGADDFYDDNGYGFGAEYDGVLLLVSMEDRDWRISTYGYGVTAITDAGIDYISDRFLPDLKEGDYAGAFAAYAELCDAFIRQAKTGQPYDGDNMPKAPFGTAKRLLIAMGIGLAVALIVTGSMKRKLKSVKQQAAAASYVKANSMHITENRDMFLYNTVTRTEKPKSSGSNSGGSSTHVSSSGRTHGGGGGKF